MLHKTACPLVICPLVDQIGQSSSGPVSHTLKFHLKTDLIYICRTFTLDQCRLLTSPMDPQKQRYLCYYHSCVYIYVYKIKFPELCYHRTHSQAGSIGTYCNWVLCSGWKCVAENVQAMHLAGDFNQDLSNLIPGFQLQTVHSWLLFL